MREEAPAAPVCMSNRTKSFHVGEPEIRRSVSYADIYWSLSAGNNSAGKIILSGPSFSMNPAAKETGFWGFGGTAVWAPIPRPVVDTPRRQSRGRLRERRARDAGALLAPRCGAARRAPHVCVPRGPARADTTSSPAADPSRAAAPAPRSLPAAAPKLPGARVSAECLRAPSSRRDG